MTERHGTGPTLGALILFIVSVLLVMAGTGYDFWQGQRQAQAISSELRALCAEERDVGLAPVSPKASALGVKLITDFRAAYAGLGCSPALPPPAGELVRMAGRYGIAVRH